MKKDKKDKYKSKKERNMLRLIAMDSWRQVQKVAIMLMLLLTNQFKEYAKSYQMNKKKK